MDFRFSNGLRSSVIRLGSVANVSVAVREKNDSVVAAALATMRDKKVLRVVVRTTT